MHYHYHKSIRLHFCYILLLELSIFYDNFIISSALNPIKTFMVESLVNLKQLIN